MLKIQNLHASYGRVRILNGVSLTVGDGDIVAVLGRNGMGKSTLLRTTIGLVPTRQGRILLDGADISRLPPHARARRGIGYVPQERLVFPRMSVRDNLRVAAFAVDRAEEQVDAVMRELPILREKAAEKASSLSGGQQQLLVIARALVASPRILLLDEPSEGIQPTIVAEIFQHVKQVNQRHGVAVLLVEQNLEFAAGLAKRVYVMSKGEIVRELPSSELLADRSLQQELMGV